MQIEASFGMKMAINAFFKQANKNGVSAILVLADSEQEQVEILCDETVISKDQAVLALEMLVDGMRGQSTQEPN